MIPSLRFGDSASGSNHKARQSKPNFKDSFLYGYSCSQGPADANRKMRAQMRKSINSVLQKDIFTPSKKQSNS